LVIRLQQLMQPPGLAENLLCPSTSLIRHARIVTKHISKQHDRAQLVADVVTYLSTNPRLDRLLTALG
jgi:hypothetical protein